MRVRGFVLITGAIALTGCSTEQRAANTAATNINAAAAAAQGDIDTYAANTMEVAVPAATPLPKAVPTPAPVERIAAATPSASVPAVDRQVPPESRVEAYPCPAQGMGTGQGVAQAVGQTRVTGRPDDAEFARPDRDAPAQRATASVWRKGDGQDLSAGREAGEQPANAGCAAN